MRILVTGGAGFIGSNLVRLLIRNGHSVLNVDKLTYAGNLQSLSDVSGDPKYHFAKVCIADADAIRRTLLEFQPDAVMHLAAESHVDRSIDGPAEFIQTNVVGTLNLLQASVEYWKSLAPEAATAFRFLQVSTDEVYGSLGADGKFTEETRYDPHSPYSASKASSDHLVRAWHQTYGLPVVVTNCSNTYGPYQFPEKLIPVVILKCLRGEPIPIYGKGENIRDWLYVEDHCAALYAVLRAGTPGQTYNIGGNNELKNIDLVHMLCKLMDEMSGEYREASNENQALSNLSPLAPSAGRGAGGEGQGNQEPRTKNQAPASFSELISFVKDRPGHDHRYAIDASKIKRELGWEPRETSETGFRKTVQWYLQNQAWWEAILTGDYRLERLGNG